MASRAAAAVSRSSSRARRAGDAVGDHLIVIPVFNEALTIGPLVARARRHGAVVVVDDGSTDDSGAAATAAGADVIRLSRQRGKGAALRRGFDLALSRGAERVVTLDGDGQHDPDEIPRLLEVAAEHPTAFVIGGRLGVSAAEDPAEPGYRVIPTGRLNAMRVAGFFIDWLTGHALRDTQSGFRIYPQALLVAARPRRGGFVLETEMLLRAAALGLPLVETPITAVYHRARRSRFRPLRDGFAVGCYLTGHGLRRWARDVGLVIKRVVGVMGAERRVPRHRELASVTAGHRDNPGAFGLAVAAFVIARTADTWQRWWVDARVIQMREAGVATAALPALAVLAVAQMALGRVGLDPLTPFIRRVYAQDRLARALRRAASPRHV
jgi:glycosyltransferase involved in cell wall biosynthesis